MLDCIHCLTSCRVHTPAQGIPVAIPGSILTAETLRFVTDTLAAGGTVTGAADTSCASVQVLADDVQLGLWAATDWA